MNKTFSIARTEFVKHLRKPTFWLTLIGVPLLAAVISFFNADASSPEKTAIPGLGYSSPVIWGDRIYLTSAVSASSNAAPVKLGLYGDIEYIPMPERPTNASTSPGCAVNAISRSIRRTRPPAEA